MFTTPCFIRKNTPELRSSALAYLKIITLIDKCYGGVPTFEERFSLCAPTWSIDYRNDFSTIKAFGCIDPVAFRTKEAAEKFLSYPENVELLRQYFMKHESI